MNTLLENHSLYKYIGGKAGTGKTTYIRDRIKDNPNYGILCSTTGISAINLGSGVTTINSLLKFYDTQTLKDRFIEGKLLATLKQLNKHYNYIAIDECSMLEAVQLDLIIAALESLNYDNEKPLGLILIGDFFQLPPVQGEWIFMANSWNEFQKNSTFLTKIWRQNNLEFIQALEYARFGQGVNLYEYLKDIGIKFYSNIDDNFIGTSIFAKNQQVDNYNTVKLMDIKKKDIISNKDIKGKALGEWDKIPHKLVVKESAYVMILNNKSIGYENGISIGFEYCNGDCGYIRDFIGDTFYIELVRTRKVVEIPRIVRYNEKKEKPSIFRELDDDPKNDIEDIVDSIFSESSDSFIPYYNKERNRWIYGEVSYHPIRLAYGITVHKSQSLTLDNVQLDIRSAFFNYNNMLYTALSRARNMEGLRIVCPVERTIIKRCNIDPKVLTWFRRLENA
jgi:hypothetical protein